ncbi:hypothetical protein [Staphylococcus caeli]|uniref:Uncharacterized protein n=1 Tax=Staphylococcus caeli TaxID=2201815 RepID=A0A1D4NFS2_9STAP|nr:hypothetical protein [Staphylococcus caeli]AWM30226.1 hypothetical protein SCC82B_00086 [Staphylococcus caeli]SCT09415.1 Uncharacterised protein [Staphylococcus caeli]SCT13610.1 Uncharacterised protein [Staphylococcus caeli]
MNSHWERELQSIIGKIDPKDVRDSDMKKLLKVRSYAERTFLLCRANYH